MIPKTMTILPPANGLLAVRRRVPVAKRATVGGVSPGTTTFAGIASAAMGGMVPVRRSVATSGNDRAPLWRNAIAATPPTVQVYTDPHNRLGVTTPEAYPDVPHGDVVVAGREVPPRINDPVLATDTGEPNDSDVR